MKQDFLQNLRSPDVSEALRRCSAWFGSVALFSAIVNILYLTGTLYMLQVYDRVLSSKSVPTLVALSAIVLATFMFQGLLDALRTRMLARIGARFDELLSARVYEVVAALPLRNPRQSETSAPIRDLDQIRSFLSGLGPTALFDLPFMPIFLIFAFLMHPWLGWMTVGGAAIIIALTVMTELRSQAPVRALAAISAERQTLVDATKRNAEVIAALGMHRPMVGRYLDISERFVGQTLRASDVTSGIGAVAKVFRLVLQSAAIGLGAYLAINGEISGGSIIAASILTSRALAPIETAISHWKGFVAARQGYRRLEHTLALVPHMQTRFALPSPSRHVQAEEIVVAPAGQTRPILKGVSLHLAAGDALGVIGPTGSGKSTLARALVGIWHPMRGRLRIDGADLDQWGDRLGDHVGYLPQDIELFGGTVAQNISRFAGRPNAADIVAAARAAAAHDMILELPQGYETPIGEAGAALSGGQRQRIALARALYGNPFLVVLDEPNANLDGQGDDALSSAINSVRARGGIVVIITHRPPGLAAVNRVAVLTDGRITAMGPRDEIMGGVPHTQAPSVPAPVTRTARPVFA